MDTEGGGWTQVLYWDSESDGHGTAEIESLMVQEYNNMSIWGDKTGYIRWADDNATADVMSYRYDITVPNSGDALFKFKFYGYSMDDSGTFFYVSDEPGVPRQFHAFGLLYDLLVHRARLRAGL